MRLALISVIASALLLTSALPASAAPRVHRGPTSPRLYKERATPSVAKPKASTARGIEPERATQIQTALISSGYMSGTPSGVWDAPTQAAMEKLQADNGWQTKLVPDARAIIKLGLGPSSEASEASVSTEGKQ